MSALFHFTPQGSRLIPRDWFLALEMAGPGGGRFSAPENLMRYGLLHSGGDAGTGLNPDRLPIGFSMEANAQAGAGPWVGLTCAACHTNEVTYRGTRFRIDGAPATFDFDRFGAELDAAVQATWQDPARLSRLARRTGTAEEPLRAAFQPYAAWSARQWSVQRPAAEAGFSRVDALGQIINAIAVLHLQAAPELLEANHRAPRAPVSYPFLWLTSRLDWVQWAPIASSPIGRNAGEVLGVFGQVRLTAPGDPQRFTSSVRFRNLHALEGWVDRLRPPSWPEATFGALGPCPLGGRAKACSRPIARAATTCPPFRMTDARLSADEARFIRVSGVPLRVVGTDGTYLRALNDRQVATGPLADLFDGAASVPAPGYFLQTVKTAVEHGTAAEGLSRQELLYTGAARACPPFTSRRMINQIPPPTGRFEARGICDIARERPFLRFLPERWAPPVEFAEAMKAGPLLGIWATGPFLHNGSVPTLEDMLQPPQLRPKVFWVGGRELDVARVGFVSDEAPGLFRFDTALPGNSNQGHAFPATPFTPAQRAAVIEFLKDPLRFDALGLR
jgi:hypothetical protein